MSGGGEVSLANLDAWRVVAVMVMTFLVSACSAYPSVSTSIGESVPNSSRGDVAVIIGVGEDECLPDSIGMRPAISDWRSYFTQVRGLAKSNVEVMTNSEVTNETVRESVQWAEQEVSEDGLLWIVCGGHGAPTYEGEN